MIIRNWRVEIRTSQESFHKIDQIPSVRENMTDYYGTRIFIADALWLEINLSMKLFIFTMIINSQKSHYNKMIILVAQVVQKFFDEIMHKYFWISSKFRGFFDEKSYW